MIEFNSRWNLDKNSLEFLIKLIKDKNIKSILEIGTFNGYTAYELSKYCNITTIEKDENQFEISKNNLKQIKNIKLIKGDAKEVIKNLKEDFNLIFIDAIKKEYIEYIKLLEEHKLIKKNTIIIADNVISHKDKVQDYLEYVKKYYNSTTLNIGKGLELSKNE